MNILFLPSNIASIPAITAECLNKKENISAKCFTISLHKYQQINDNVIFAPKSVSKLTPLEWLYTRLKYRKDLKKWIEWADVLHYMWSPGMNNGADLKWAKAQNKTIIVEWIGSEIRNPEILIKINPYYAKALENGYEYKLLEESNYKDKVQKLFYNAGASVCVSPEITLYLNKVLYPHYRLLNQRLNLEDFTPQYPSLQNNRPLIVHSPSAKIAKGSDIIISVIEELKKKFNFDFVLLHDTKREKALEIMQKADIFIDQIIIGGYGMAATEAMAFGKPVLCYILPQVFEAGLSPECAIVNTNPDNLKEHLVKLITDSQLRHEIGVKSRKFAEKFHDVEKVSSQLLTVYKIELEKRDNA